MYIFCGGVWIRIGLDVGFPLPQGTLLVHVTTMTGYCLGNSLLQDGDRFFWAEFYCWLLFQRNTEKRKQQNHP